MKTIDSYKKMLITNILLTIFIVIISIPIWLSFNLNSAESYAKAYDNYYYINYEILNTEKPQYNLAYVDDDRAMRNIETQNIVVYNNSNTLDTYLLILKVAKNKDIDSVKININYKIDYLSNYFACEDDKYNYYVLDQNDLMASSKKYVISMWNSNEKVKDNTNIDYEFSIDKSLYI